MSTITDAITLKLLRTNELFTAIGNELFCNYVKENKTISQFYVRFKDKIHGIVPLEETDQTVLCLYGGREFVVWKRQTNDYFCSIAKKGKINDWISNALYYNTEPASLCLVTAHNVAIRLQVNKKMRFFEIIEKSFCEDNSIQYCSQISGSTWATTVIFSGTALGEILMWMPANRPTGLNKSPILQKINAHKGVIFSIACNWEKNLLVTTSDDRSVRFWRVQRPATPPNCPIRAIKAVFGHTARVFKSLIINDDKFSTLILSVGEDSNLCVWNLDGHLIYRRRLHFNATIWDLEYDDKSKTIFSCGQDGNIRKFGLEYILENVNKVPIEIMTNDISGSYMGKIRLIDNNILIGVTNTNRLVYLQNDSSSWIDITDHKCYKSAVLETYSSLIGIAGYKTASLFEYKKLNGEITLKSEANILDNMIRSFHFLSATELLLVDDKGNCVITDKNFAEKFKFRLPKSKEMWTTAAYKIENFLLLADRCGHLHLFAVKDEYLQLCHTLKFVHGRLGITSISYEEKNSDEIIVISTGHDGRLKRIVIDKNKLKVFIRLTEKVDVLWIEKLIRYSDRNDNRRNLIIGFNDNSFIVWEKKSDIIYQLSCGGGHRFWDIFINCKNLTATLVFIRNKKLYKINFPLENETRNCIELPVNNWHVKSCNVLKSYQNSVRDTFLVSGGDDNILKIHKVLPKYQLNLIGDVVTHISNIRAIELKILNDNEILIFSAGGRAQLCVTKLVIAEKNYIIQEEYNYMLKSNDIERNRWRKGQQIDFDPETRFMCMAIVEDDFLKFTSIYVGCSDGYIRKLNYHQKDDDPSMNLEASVYYGNCILNIHIFTTNWNKKILLTMGTDGDINFWDITNNLSEDSMGYFKLKHHDSGINCYAFSTREHGYCIATGGDDQKLTITTFKMDKLNVKIINTLSSNSLHTAQITGVKFFNDDRLLSTSVDQTILYINVHNLTIVQKWYRSVADIKGIEIYRNKRPDEDKWQKIAVYGAGISIFDSGDVGLLLI